MTTVLPPDDAAARAGIAELYARYVLFADAKDVTGLDTLFEATASCDYSADGLGVMSWQEFREHDSIQGRGVYRVNHLFGDHRVELAPDLATASVWSKVHCFIAPSAEVGSPVIGLIGTYEDLVALGEGEWRFRHRRWHPDFALSGLTVAPGPFDTRARTS